MIVINHNRQELEQLETDNMCSLLEASLSSQRHAIYDTAHTTRSIESAFYSLNYDDIGVYSHPDLAFSRTKRCRLPSVPLIILGCGIIDCPLPHRRYVRLKNGQQLFDCFSELGFPICSSKATVIKLCPLRTRALPAVFLEFPQACLNEAVAR